MRNVLLIPLILVVLALGGGGCTSEETRNLNRQNGYAGGFIETNAADPGIRQAGKDIKENSGVIEKLEGPPKVDVKYSPDASAKARDAGEKAAAGGGFWKTVGAGAIGLALLVWGLVKQTAAAHAAEALEAVVSGGVNLVKKAAAGQPLPAEEVKGTLNAAVKLAPPKVQSRIEETLTRVKKKLEKVVAT